jgi:hypothetical protein
MSKPKCFLRYQPQHLAFLTKNQEMPRRELTEFFNAEFGTTQTECSIKTICTKLGLKTGRTGQLPKGGNAWNKGKTGYMGANITSFKKGQPPPTISPVGWLRQTVDGYMEIKTANPNVFRLVHHVVYENHVGKIPKGHVILFRDGDTKNCAVDNLVLIKRDELAVLNRCLGWGSAHDEVKPVLINLSKLMAGTHRKIRELSA